MASGIRQTHDKREIPIPSPSIPQFGQFLPDEHYRLRPGAYAVIRDGRGQVAIVETPESVVLPGGGQEPGESMEQTVIREVREETALRIKLTGRIGVADQLVWGSDLKQYLRKRCTFFTATKVGQFDMPTEVDHTLTWLEHDQAESRLTLESERWALLQSHKGLGPVSQ